MSLAEVQSLVVVLVPTSFPLHGLPRVLVLVYADSGGVLLGRRVRIVAANRNLKMKENF